MAFRLTSIANIGSYQFFGGLNDCVIKRSVKEIVDTAVIKIPAIGRVNTADTLNSGLPQNSIATSKLFNEGDLVTIQLGYNNQNFQEFKGFVRRVDASIPVVIECEGYAWQLRRVRTVQTWKTVKLLDFLKVLTAGTDIKLSPFIPNMVLSNLKINHANSLKALEYVKEHVHLSVYFIFDTLYVGLEEGLPGKVVKHRLGWNTVRDDKLKWRLAEDTKVQVRLVTGKGKNKKRTLYTAGDTSGSMVTKNIANLSNEGDLQAVANDLLQQAKYTGFEGGVTCFLQPFAQMCDTDALTDKIYNERGGNYFLQGTDVHFGMNGAQRICFLGRTLSGAINAS
jgi:hypothetical protein